MSPTSGSTQSAIEVGDTPLMQGDVINLDAISLSEEGEARLVATPAGVALLSQTCDLVQGKERFLVAPVIEDPSDSTVSAARRGREPPWQPTGETISGLNQKEAQELATSGSINFKDLTRIAHLIRANQGKNETSLSWLWEKFALEVNTRFFSIPADQTYVAAASFTVLTDREFTYEQVRTSVRLDFAAISNSQVTIDP